MIKSKDSIQYPKNISCLSDIDLYKCMYLLVADTHEFKVIRSTDLNGKRIGDQTIDYAKSIAEEQAKKPIVITVGLRSKYSSYCDKDTLLTCLHLDVLLEC